MLRLNCITLTPVHCLQLPATALHDVATSTVTLRNTTAEPQTFEFSVPAGSDLSLSPHVATLKAEGTLSVMLRYCPQPQTLPAAPEAGLQTAASSAAAGSAAETASHEEADTQVNNLIAAHCPPAQGVVCIPAFSNCQLVNRHQTADLHESSNVAILDRSMLFGSMPH